MDYAIMATVADCNHSQAVSTAAGSAGIASMLAAELYMVQATSLLTSILLSAILFVLFCRQVWV
jgi:hypothetical protein